MFIDTSEFASASRPVDVTFERPPMEGTVGSGEPVHLVGTVRRVRDGVRLTGHLDTAVKLTCSRCGDPYTTEIAGDFALVYRGREQSTHASDDNAGMEVMLSEEDFAEAELDSKGRIDLLGLATEQVYLALPLKPICREDCRGLCSVCGNNLNDGSCSCAELEADPRWGPLASLKKQLTNKNP